MAGDWDCYRSFVSLEIGDAEFRVRILPGALEFSLGDCGSLTLLLGLQTLRQSKQRTSLVFIFFQIVAKLSFGVVLFSDPHKKAAERLALWMAPLEGFAVIQ